ncbi:hypothetical protein [Methylibium petroleiphilum]|uniref:Lipoprotein n=1 Tax=Methylibium petroleiphilum (strain ATCC BAA-1232 / LMG 22953 / PM1) TaxID=420662 RepID=A2SMB4_METPP|nr:hypothetical protein [Methylibium petroleiphilum]ABM96703.1 hypothetical protein Mpe_A3750 [Methylibium petroleiphilum PM1]
MTTRTRRWCGALVAGLCAVGAAAADEREATPRRLYDVSTETGMPHLDENLRYAVRREQRCLAVADRATVFWMLQDVSLQDCRLEPLDDATYRLACHGGHGTTGDARWQSDARDRWTGTLNVRLGGKNMTFFQRVTATPVGECGDAHARP